MLLLVTLMAAVPLPRRATATSQEDGVTVIVPAIGMETAVVTLKLFNASIMVSASESVYNNVT